MMISHGKLIQQIYASDIIQGYVLSRHCSYCIKTKKLDLFVLYHNIFIFVSDTSSSTMNTEVRLLKSSLLFKKNQFKNSSSFKNKLKIKQFLIFKNLKQKCVMINFNVV